MHSRLKLGKSSVKSYDGGSMNQISYPPVSVILPILNEERDLASCISAILQQSYSGELEVILALGPSSDNTDQIATQLAAKDSRIKLVKNPSGKTASALNLAIGIAKNEIICRIDGHAQINDSYIATAVKVLQETGAVNVGGLMNAVGTDGFESAVAGAMKSKLGVGASKFHTGGVAGPADTVYLGTFKKSAVLQVGGFNEKYIRAQDWELNHRLRLAGGVIWFDPRLIVTYRPRSTFAKLAKQYFQYGRWRRAVSRSHPGTINFRYLAPPVALVLNLISLLLGSFLNSLFFIPVIIYLTLIIIGGVIVGKTFAQKLRLPSVFLTMHMAWGLGFLSSPSNLLKD
jgi:glycosyltransferase involved in cell wall biosynthesis